MMLYQWANKWGVPGQAVAELLNHLTSVQTDPDSMRDARAGSEANNSQLMRMDAPRNGALLFRNNVGVAQNEAGGVIRFGICNETEEINKRIKSSDFIGIKKVLIEPHHVGTVIGQFAAREMKPSDWTYSGTDRERAQLKFIELVAGMGGDARFNNTGRF